MNEQGAPSGTDGLPAAPSLLQECLETDAVMRPAIFSHQPKPRLPPIERYYGASPSAFGQVDVLEEVKSSRFEGIYNLSFIFLIFSLVYLAIRNIMEIGFQISFAPQCLTKLHRDAVTILPVLFAFAISHTYSFVLIKLHVYNCLPQSSIMLFHGAGQIAYYTSITTYVLNSSVNPLFALSLSIVIVVVSLKQHSWISTNLILAEETEKLAEARRLRQSEKPCTEAPAALSTKQEHHDSTKGPSKAQLEYESPWTREGSIGDSIGSILMGHQEEVPFPRNVTLGNYSRFLVYPTLVYETSYPRTLAVRPRYVAWYLAQAVLCFIAVYLLLVQFCVPVWRSARELDRLWFFCMKLALPSFICWLLMFWGFFHCLLSAVAEITYFADREFYQDWWNSTTIEGYWRKWNRPVHEWCLRHIYVDGISRHKMEKSTAALGTFLLSAIMHEYVCLVGFQLLRPYMFLGMLVQVPLVAVSRGMAGTRHGNMLMWLMLFSGQAVIIILYVRDYLTQNGKLMC